MILNTRTDDIPIYNIQHVGHVKQYPLVTSLERFNTHYCLLNNKWVKCSTVKVYNTMNTLTTTVYEETVAPLHNPNRMREQNHNMKSLYNDAQPVHKWYYVKRFPGVHGRPRGYPVTIRHPGYASSVFQIQKTDQKTKMHSALTKPHTSSHAAHGVVTPAPAHATQVNTPSTVAYAPLKLNPPTTEGVHTTLQSLILPKNMSSIENFPESLDTFERQFYMVSKPACVLCII